MGFLKRAMKNVNPNDLKHVINDDYTVEADWKNPKWQCDWHLGTVMTDHCTNKKYAEYDYCIHHLCEMIEQNQSQFIKEFNGLPFVYRNAEEQRLFKRLFKVRKKHGDKA